MDAVRDVSLVAALVTTGLMAGVYLAFSIAVLPGIARDDDRTFVLAMRGMNTAILNPVFAVVFGGPLVLGVLAVATRLPSAHRGGLGWTLLALGLYVVTLVVTGVVNVPLNNRLESTEPLDEARAGFERRWVCWNVVRTVVCAASFVALVPPLTQL
jgi:uncharacterized membrane protein